MRYINLRFTYLLTYFPSNAVLVHCLNSTSCFISSIFFTHGSYSCCCMTP